MVVLKSYEVGLNIRRKQIQEYLTFKQYNQSIFKKVSYSITEKGFVHATAVC